MEGQNNTPEIRFPEFDLEWKERRLGEVTRWYSGGTPSKKEQRYWHGNIPWISASSMQGLEYGNSKLMISNDGLRNGSRLAQKGWLLILVRGSMLFNKIPIGIAIKDIAFNQDVKAIEVSSESNAKYILYYLYSKESKLLNIVSGTGIGAGKLDLDDLKTFNTSIPSLPEQQKIAFFFTAIDQKISQLKRKKTLLEQYKKGVMQKIFSQEIRFRDENGQEFPKWEKKRLGEIAVFSKGKGISKNDIVDNGNVECIRYGELYTEYQETIDEVKSRTNLNPSELVLSEADDVIIPASGETQIDIAKASCVLKGGIALGGDLNIIRSDYNGVFLSYYMNSKINNDIAKLAQGISVVHLYSSQLSILKVEVPNHSEQTKIVDFLTAIDDKIIHTQTQINNTELWKKGLLQKMFV